MFRKYGQFCNLLEELFETVSAERSYRCRGELVSLTESSVFKAPASKPRRVQLILLELEFRIVT